MVHRDQWRLYQMVCLITDRSENFRDAYAQAQRSEQHVLIFPTILHWEDSATGWFEVKRGQE
jgi:hypothetical protein